MTDAQSAPPAPRHIVADLILEEIGEERSRQIAVEGFDPAHDDNHRRGEIAGAAACYALNDLDIPDPHMKAQVGYFLRDLWPWARAWWKPKERRRNLITAAALIVAEIERIDRATRQADFKGVPDAGGDAAAQRG